MTFCLLTNMTNMPSLKVKKKIRYGHASSKKPMQSFMVDMRILSKGNAIESLLN